MAEINTDRLCTGIMSLMHQIATMKTRIEHSKFILENRVKLQLDTKDVQDDIAANTFNLESLTAVKQAAERVLYNLTSETKVSVAE
jgi:hypothetical protein